MSELKKLIEGLPIKVLSKDAVIISAEVLGRDTILELSRQNGTVHTLFYRVILALMDEFEKPKKKSWDLGCVGGQSSDCAPKQREPAPKWEPGMWFCVEYKDGKGHGPHQADYVGHGNIVYMELGQLRVVSQRDCRRVPAPKEEKPTPEIAASISFQGCGEATGVNRVRSQRIPSRGGIGMK